MSDQYSKSSASIEIAIVGGGITGLAAAWQLSEMDNVTVTVLEASDTVGGKLSAQSVHGLQLDAGAESLLAVRPEAVRLAKEVGLEPAIVHPAVGQAAILSRGHLRPIPTGLIGGVPTDLRSLAASQILSLPGLLRVPLDLIRTPSTIGDDISVGKLIAERMGAEVVDRVTEPLLAGVYASDPYRLSLRMTSPVLFRALSKEPSLLRASTRMRAASASVSGARRGPTFAGIRGGIWRLAAKTAEALAGRGVMVRTKSPVASLRRRGNKWLVSVTGETRYYDAVIVATPAAQAADLLSVSAPFAALNLRGIDYADVALVTLVYPAATVGALQGTGFLSPPVEGHQVKGVTYVTNKWDWAARAAASHTPRGNIIVRASVGRYGDNRILDSSDEEIVATTLNELNKIVGLPQVSVDSNVTRWPQALPQYQVGHVDTVARIRSAIGDVAGLAIAGAAYDGVGIAACIASGRAAATSVMEYALEVQERKHG